MHRTIVFEKECLNHLEGSVTTYIKKENFDSQSQIVGSNVEIKQELIPPFEESPEYNTGRNIVCNQEVNNYKPGVVTKKENVEKSGELFTVQDIFSGKENDIKLYEQHEIKNELTVGPTAVETAILGHTNYLLHLKTGYQNNLYNENDVYESKHHECNIAFNKLHSCEVCREVFKTYKALKHHVMVIHTGYKNASESNLKDVANHSTEHHTVICELCNKTLKSSKNLDQHRRIHTGVKPHHCKVCKKSFYTNSLLKRHMFVHVSERPYICEICKKCYKSKHELKHHILTHNNVRPYICDVCKDSFKTRHHLSRHMDTHTLKKPFKCDICDMSFKRKEHLQRHVHTHSGHKEYSCAVCTKSFITKYYLQRHMAVHSDMKYSCNICKKCFKDMRYLKQHLSTHTTQTPYSCDRCKKYFKTKNGVKRHWVAQACQILYSCDVCKEKFRKKYILEKHIMDHIHVKVKDVPVQVHSMSTRSSVRRQRYPPVSYVD
ncbi:gastrula zinc finger protein XlCGF46.1-like [Achroia grisella]|uniref:gastrula zinc finger protein XlCGF46.1-like n=1 Tax=Achroia grisella TaxID=688607 RepID=UPI0027D226C4|nr:gastrula zinc finger protein XlCGF46.1-like [Achroia grisella]